MRKLEIKGYGYVLPKETVEFKGGIRYKISGEETNGECESYYK